MNFQFKETIFRFHVFFVRAFLLTPLSSRQAPYQTSSGYQKMSICLGRTNPKLPMIAWIGNRISPINHIAYPKIFKSKQLSFWLFHFAVREGYTFNIFQLKFQIIRIIKPWSFDMSHSTPWTPVGTIRCLHPSCREGFMESRILNRICQSRHGARSKLWIDQFHWNVTCCFSFLKCLQ